MLLLYVSKFAITKYPSIYKICEKRMQGYSSVLLFLFVDQKIDMTAPVATKILPGAGPNCENTFTTSFYIPPEHQDNPPKPTNPDVFIEDRPAMDVYVKSFGGFAKEQDWLSEAQKMTEQIKDKNTINQDYWFTAGYNSPFQLFARTNEVWLIKNKDKE